MILWGWGTKIINDCFIGIRLCRNCRDYTETYLARQVFRITIFFIPIFWSTKNYYILCGRCQVGYPIDKESYVRLKKLYAHFPNSQIVLESFRYIINQTHGLECTEQNLLSVYDNVSRQYAISDFENDYKQLIKDVLAYGTIYDKR